MEQQLHLILERWTDKNRASVARSLGISRSSLYVFLRGIREPDPRLIVLWADLAGASAEDRARALRLRAGL